MFVTRVLMLAATSAVALMGIADCAADVLDSGPDGFRIKVERKTDATPEKIFDALINDFSKWWDPSHTYSGKAENLSMDLDKRCMFEQLPGGGFVRHMEIVYYEPGKAMRLVGGLGPLQERGVSAALTIQIVENDEGSTIVMSYNVSGFAGFQLDKNAEAVDFVITDQLERLQKYLE